MGIVYMITDELKDDSFHFGVEEIQIGDHCSCRLRQIILNDYHYLKRIIIGNDSLQLTMIFTIDNCNELESVNIGDDSFYRRAFQYRGYQDVDHHTPQYYYFKIKNCMKIKELIIGENSFIHTVRYFVLQS